MSHYDAIPVTELHQQAARILRAAGRKFLLPRLSPAEAPADSEVNVKGDYVTRMDVQIEEYICRRLLRLTPRAQVLTEESGLLGPERASLRWILDPIDGTINFIHQLPYCCISLALEYEGERLLGLVYSPGRKEFYSAIKDGGAFLNGHPITVSGVTTLAEAAISTGFNPRLMDHIDQVLTQFRAFLMTTMGVRRFGAAALDLCQVAAGRLDAFYEEGLKPWDIAAGTLILEEAGGRCTDYKGNGIDIYGDELVASNGRIHEQLLAVFNWSATTLRVVPQGGEDGG